ncbi:SWIM zinc finger family protein [Limnohabitans sp.]|jgi:uncharacterized Zn finger protein|uniref:SWIM zinc finger family protein n=1 Tax=Limnohabitans sp. TaxID=1907725 RepID=UPI0037C1B25B
MGYFGYKPYASVASRRANALKAVAKANKKGTHYAPIAPYTGAIAKTFWGKAWCSNLEQYSDYESRLPRGRSYVRNGSVIDLQISTGSVRALVMGSSLYEVDITIQALPEPRWKAVCADCANSVASLIELLQGKLSKPVMERICAPTTGLFPSPKELKFECSCPDWAGMCKHVAAVFYGVGARMDQQPELLFKLRHVNALDLVAQASVAQPSASKTKSSKVMDASDLGDVFGLDMDLGVDTGVDTAPAKPKTTQVKAPVKVAAKAKTAAKAAPKATAKKSTKTPAKTTAKTTATKTAAKAAAKPIAKKTVAKKAVKQRV